MTHLAALVVALFALQDTDATYVDRETGFSIPIPPGWTVERPPQGEGVVKMYPSKGDDTKITTFKLYTHDPNEDLVSGKMEPNDFIQILSKEYAKGFEGFEVIKSDGQRRGDHVVLVFTYRATIGGVKLRAYEYHVFTKKRFYQLIWMTQANFYEKHEGTFERISKGFTCEEAASTEKEDPSLDYADLVKQAKDASGKKNYDEAIELGKKALRAKTDNKWDAYYTIGYAYFYKFDYAESAKYELMSLEAAPDNETVLLDCLEALMCAGRGAETRKLVEAYRDKKVVASARDQTLLAYLDLSSFVVDGEYRRDQKTFMKKLNKFVTEMEDLGKAIPTWDTAGTDNFVDMHVRSDKSKKIMAAIHDLLKWKMKPQKFKDTLEKIMEE